MSLEFFCPKSQSLAEPRPENADIIPTWPDLTKWILSRWRWWYELQGKEVRDNHNVLYLTVLLQVTKTLVFLQIQTWFKHHIKVHFVYFVTVPIYPKVIKSTWDPCCANKSHIYDVVSSSAGCSCSTFLYTRWWSTIEACFRPSQVTILIHCLWYI